MACPMPRAAPVTRLILPARSHFMMQAPTPGNRSTSSRGLFKECTQRLQKPRGWRAVGDAVVERQAQCHLGTDNNRVADDHRTTPNPADPQDRAFGIVDDRREGVDAEA